MNILSKPTKPKVSSAFKAKGPFALDGNDTGAVEGINLNT